MDGGYKSYSTGMVNYKSLVYNHDCRTLKETKSLYDPPRSAMHKSFRRIGKRNSVAIIIVTIIIIIIIIIITVIIIIIPIIVKLGSCNIIIFRVWISKCVYA